MSQSPEPKKLQTVIVSRPGIMQEALRAAFLTFTDIETIGLVGDGLSAVNLLRLRQPNLLVIDSNLLEDEVAALMGQVKRDWPAVRCLFLAQTNHQKQWALTVGADASVLRDDPLEELRQATAPGK